MATMHVGERVRIKVVPETERSGIAGKVGVVRGTRAAEAIDAAVVGDPTTAGAVKVYLADLTSDVWLVPALLEPVGIGTVSQSAGNRGQDPTRPRKLNWLLRFFKALRKYR